MDSAKPITIQFGDEELREPLNLSRMARKEILVAWTSPMLNELSSRED